MKLCFATNNQGKLQEIKSLLEGQFEIVSLQEIGCGEELPETKDTIEGNSLEKADYVWKHYGVSCFADDTGLEVAALNGEPGVFSARYAGPDCTPNDNIILLLHKMTEKEDRSAMFRTCISLILDGEVYQFEGNVKGEILHLQQGEKGFGYDPVFRPAGYEKSFAEMTMAEKNTMSHRAKAVEALVGFLKNRV